MPEISEQEIFDEAKARVKKKREFFSHLGAYITVNLVLVIIWALSGSGYRWFLWPLGIWGAFVAWNFIEVFVRTNSVQSEKIAIQKEIERIRRRG